VGSTTNYKPVRSLPVAKAFARFKELDKKAFAEYVLIGTLASILIALIAASFISSLNKADPSENHYFLGLLTK